MPEFTNDGAAVKVAPEIPQTTAAVIGTTLAVSVTQRREGRVILDLDAGTAAVLIDLARKQMVEWDAAYRRGAQRPGDTWPEIAGSAAVRLRTVVDALAAAQRAAGGRFATYDVD